MTKSGPQPTAVHSFWQAASVAFPRQQVKATHVPKQMPPREKSFQKSLADRPKPLYLEGLRKIGSGWLLSNLPEQAGSFLEDISLKLHSVG